MANYKKYAENLIGNWEKDIYAPQQKIAQEVYQTNWDKLTNDLNVLKDQLARNFENAKMDYSNALSDIQDASFNRMNAAYNDLAARGLSASGKVNDLIRADTSLKGQEADKALSDLMGATKTNISDLTEGVNKYGESQTSLATDLAKDLGKLTDADAANNQQYANLVGGIAENAAQRAANNAISRMSRASDNDKDELTRRMAIADLLRSADYTDDEKISMMVIYGDVPVEQAKSAVSAYNYDIADAKVQKTQGLLDNLVNKNGLDARFYTPEGVSAINNVANRLSNDELITLISNNKKGISPVNYDEALYLDYINNEAKGNVFKNLKATNYVNAINRQTQNRNKYTYGDIYNILYGNK